MAKKTPLAPLATRVKKDPKLLARALADPGLRSKLPDKYLTSAQRAARSRNTYLANVGNIGQPLTGQSLVDTARQTVDADYAPLLSDVGQQEKIVNTSAGIQGDRAKRYYGDLNGLLTSIGGAQTAANANAVQGAINAGTAAHGAVTAADTAAQGRLAQDAALRGTDVQGDAVANQAARTQTAQDAVTGNAQAAQTSAQNFGDVQSAFLKGLQGATAQQGGEYQQQITGQQGQLLNALGQTRKDLSLKQAGAFTNALMTLRQNEQQSAITQAGLLDKDQQAALSAAADAGSGGQKYGYTPSEWLALPASTRTAIVTAANKKTPAAKTGYGPGAPGMNKYGYTYEEWTALSSSEKTKARAGKGTKGTGTDGATNTEVGSAQAGVGDAQSAARAAGIPVDRAHRKQLQGLISAGRGGGDTVSITQKTKDGSVTRKVPVGPDGKALRNAPSVIDKHDPVYTSVALDVLIDGHVSRYNAQRLHARGLTVADLGLPSYTQWLKTHKNGAGGSKLSPSERAPGGT